MYFQIYMAKTLFEKQLCVPFAKTYRPPNFSKNIHKLYLLGNETLGNLFKDILHQKIQETLQKIP